MISIRRAERTEAKALAKLAAATFTETFGGLYGPEDVAAYLKKNHTPDIYESLLADDCWGVWIAETQDGEAAGYCVAGPCALSAPDMPAGAGELLRLYVRQGNQGAGLGGRMLTMALDWLAPRFAPICVSVFQNNFAALRLYQRFSFVKIHDGEYKVGGQADPVWIMRLGR